MGDKETCKAILDIVPETAVLAFDVVGWTEADGAKQIAKSKEIREAIEKELTKQANDLAKKHFEGKKISEEDAAKFLKTVPSKILEAQQKEMTSRLSCAFNESPIGVWIDKNSWVLYVFAPIVVGAAGTYMYTAKTGDLPASWAASMAKVNKSFNVKSLGKITIGTTDVKFVPSKRDLSVLAFGEMKWERVSFKLTLGGGVTGGSFSTGAIGLDVNTVLSRNWDLKAGTMAISHEGNWGGRSTLGLEYKGSGAAADLRLVFAAQFAYGQVNTFEAMPALKGPSALGGTLSVGLRF